MKTAEELWKIQRGNQLVLKILAESLNKSGYKFLYEDSTSDLPYLRSRRLIMK
ncbi:hypothetical protein [Leucothrix pacifica]|uniref:hypothetical protein n=1 Tax=Leucothrix pacifica TaxID=1247513 RepID=UPI0015E85E0B|nr:hypothetical protein [Leucothrix pacifica]